MKFPVYERPYSFSTKQTLNRACAVAAVASTADCVIVFIFRMFSLSSYMFRCSVGLCRSQRVSQARANVKHMNSVCCTQSPVKHTFNFCSHVKYVKIEKIYTRQTLRYIGSFADFYQTLTVFFVCFYSNVIYEQILTFFRVLAEFHNDKNFFYGMCNQLFSF